MKFINGITLAELLSLPELMKAKIANLNDKNSENRSILSCCATGYGSTLKQNSRR